MNSLERQIVAQQKHIDNLYETIKGWEQVAKDKDKIIKKYQEQVENYVGVANVSGSFYCSNRAIGGIKAKCKEQCEHCKNPNYH